MLSRNAREQGALNQQPTREHDGRPARFVDALAVAEFRTIYSAGILSWVGDYIARAAVTALVFHVTNSVVAAAAAFAITYAPWLLGGSVLVSLAERYPYRTVMITCDIARMILMAAVAIPVPWPVVLGLLLASALFSPPFDAARSATLPMVLPGDRYVVGVALTAATTQPVQVAGYLTGSAIAAVNPRLALLINAGTFGVSALLLRLGVRRREPALRPERRTHLLRETVDGFRLVFGTPALRTLILLVFSGSIFAIVPEGLGAPWAAEISGPDDRGLTQGLIMAAVPFGSILGALTMSRLLRPAVRRRLLGPLAIATPLALVGVVLDPPAAAIAVLAAACGFAFGGLLPVANGEFVKILPNEYRARAFGVVSGGLQLLQGAAVLITGALAHRLSVSTIVGLWSIAGVVLMVSLVRPWASTVTGVVTGAMPAARAPVPGTGSSMPAAVPGTMEP